MSQHASAGFGLLIKVMKIFTKNFQEFFRRSRSTGKLCFFVDISGALYENFKIMFRVFLEFRSSKRAPWFAFFSQGRTCWLHELEIANTIQI